MRGSRKIIILRGGEMICSDYLQLCNYWSPLPLPHRITAQARQAAVTYFSAYFSCLVNQARIGLETSEGVLRLQYQ